MSHYALLDRATPRPSSSGTYNGTDDLSLKGLPAVRDYFGRALERNPTLCGLTRCTSRPDLRCVILVYKRMTGDLAAEAFFLDQAGKITRSVSHYG